MPYTFYGGVHPPTFKTLTLDRPLKKTFIPRKVVLPLLQHTGSPAEPIVAAGDAVKAGDRIAKASGFISSDIHATISGKVTGINYHSTPTVERVLSMTIEAQGDEDQEFKASAAKDIEGVPAETLLEMVKCAGVVGLGGAAFPTHVKLSPPKTKPVDSVIVNGAECEPYLTCDHRIMVEKSKEILKGIEIVRKVLGARDVYIAIENNKRSAIYAFERLLASRRDAGIDDRVEIAVLATKYPQGAEKQIIKSVLGRIVPVEGLPMDVGAVVLNVGTVFAIYEAVYLKKPLIERAITVTGSIVREPMNLWVRIGTLASDLASYAGLKSEARKVIVGGPMMGVAQHTMDVPVTKGTTGLLFMSKEELDRSVEDVCIRCGKCVEICPMGLAPTTLMYRVKKGNFAEAKAFGITSCYECASCAYICPAKIPLLDYMKYGKAKVGVNG